MRYSWALTQSNVTGVPKVSKTLTVSQHRVKCVKLTVSYDSSVLFQQTEFRNQRVYAGTLSKQALCYIQKQLPGPCLPGVPQKKTDYTKQLQSYIYRQPLIEQPHLTRLLFNQSLVSKS